MINILELLKRKVTLFMLFVCLAFLTGCSFKAENDSSDEISRQAVYKQRIKAIELIKIEIVKLKHD